MGAELKAPWTSYPDTEALTDSSCQPEPNGSCFQPPRSRQVLPPQEAPPFGPNKRKKPKENCGARQKAKTNIGDAWSLPHAQEPWL